MDALIDSLVPGMPQFARAAIADQAEGIPLFAVETVRSLVDRDIVVPRDGVYTLVGDIGTLSVPDGLRPYWPRALTPWIPICARWWQRPPSWARRFPR